MPLKPVVSSLDEVPEAFRSEYELSEDKKFYLKLDGDDIPKLRGALDNERKDRKKAKEQLEELAKKFDGLDADQARAALKRIQELEDGALPNDPKFKAELLKQTERMRADFDNQNSAMKKALEKENGRVDGLSGQLSKLLIEGKIREVATKNGVRSTALEDVLLRGQRVWKLQDGKPVPLNPEGQTIYGKNGVDALSMEEWVGALATDAPHLFESSSGGGARGGTNGGGPGAPGTINVRDQDALNNSIQAIAEGKTKVVA